MSDSVYDEEEFRQKAQAERAKQVFRLSEQARREFNWPDDKPLTQPDLRGFNMLSVVSHLENAELKGASSALCSVFERPLLLFGKNKNIVPGAVSDACVVGEARASREPDDV